MHWLSSPPVPHTCTALVSSRPEHRPTECISSRPAPLSVTTCILALALAHASTLTSHPFSTASARLDATSPCLTAFSARCARLLPSRRPGGHRPTTLLAKGTCRTPTLPMQPRARCTASSTEVQVHRECEVWHHGGACTCPSRSCKQVSEAVELQYLTRSTRDDLSVCLAIILLLKAVRRDM